MARRNFWLLTDSRNIYFDRQYFVNDDDTVQQKVSLSFCSFHFAIELSVSIENDLMLDPILSEITDLIVIHLASRFNCSLWLSKFAWESLPGHLGYFSWVWRRGAERLMVMANDIWSGGLMSKARLGSLQFLLKERRFLKIHHQQQDLSWVWGSSVSYSVDFQNILSIKPLV